VNSSQAESMLVELRNRSLNFTVTGFPSLALLNPMKKIPAKNKSGWFAEFSLLCLTTAPKQLQHKSSNTSDIGTGETQAGSASTPCKWVDHKGWVSVCVWVWLLVIGGGHIWINFLALSMLSVNYDNLGGSQAQFLCGTVIWPTQYYSQVSA